MNPRTEQEVKERIRYFEQRKNEHRANTDGRTNHYSHGDSICSTASNILTTLYWALGYEEREASGLAWK